MVGHDAHIPVRGFDLQASIEDALADGIRWHQTRLLKQGVVVGNGRHVEGLDVAVDGGLQVRLRLSGWHPYSSQHQEQSRHARVSSAISPSTSRTTR